MRDLYHNIAAVPALAPAVQAASIDGAAIDLLGFNRAAIIVSTGAIVSTGDFSVKLQESDASGSGFADVDVAYVDTDAPATLEATSAYRLGYRGHKRYIRTVLTKAGGTSIAASAVAVLGDPATAPVA
ncbi:hypothetical protein ASD04_00135 [Devosia sp. Root436]|uniref:hypothetical protein n=1 Tax=Devosia sp. Root436 TaxID=1736537 RepID=UPI0006F46188|nr:hypothetical protein [Devosia sp. Root436]KQX42418.1 hypothetical protein ASD04_00135 [Devosia sp. Root436]